jgi:hypothetical protein
MASSDVFIQPLDLSHFAASPPGDSPGFTQLVQDVLGDAASPVDGFDAAVGDAAALVEALDKILGEQDAALDAVLVSLDTTNPAPLDNSMLGYTGTAATGAGIIAAGSALAPPNLLELPISPSSGGIPLAPPIITGHDFGDVKLGGNPVGYGLGTAVFVVNGPSLGLYTVDIVNMDQPEWEIVITEHDTNNGDQHLRYDLVFHPNVLGHSTCQVNTSMVNSSQFTIYTFTANVVP